MPPAEFLSASRHQHHAKFDLDPAWQQLFLGKAVLEGQRHMRSVLVRLRDKRRGPAVEACAGGEPLDKHVQAGRLGGLGAQAAA